MVSVNLYQPGKISCNIPFPENWNELLLQELLCICHHQLTKSDTVEQQKAAIFTDLLTIRSKPFKKQLPTNFFELIDIDDAAGLGLLLLDFLYKDNKLTEQLFPQLSLQRKKMFGPAGDFNDLTCGEFEDAEIFFQHFIADPCAEHLAHLAAILYRPKNTPYMQFSKHKWITYDHEKYYNRFLQLQHALLYAIFVWYSGCRAMLPLYFPTVYKKDTKQDSENEIDLMAFTKCIHHGAGPKNGTRADIRRTLIKEFFTDMELEAINAEKLIEQYANRER